MREENAKDGKAFFFSSRRRHTRYIGDWSSDVCSSDLPRLILDAGTGLRRVTGLLGGAPFAGTIILTHLHWDHVHGLPFFSAGDRDDARVTLLLPEQEAQNEEGRDRKSVV